MKYFNSIPNGSASSSTLASALLGALFLTAQACGGGAKPAPSNPTTTTAPQAQSSSKKGDDGKTVASAKDTGGAKQAKKRDYFKKAQRKANKKADKANKADAVPPNVIIILSDDVGYQEAGFQGSKKLKTPHLDALAESGVKFTNGYATSSVCSPSRAGLLTGRYQQRFGVEDNQGSPVAEEDGTTNGLPLNQLTIANTFKSAGYDTVALGKWHLGTAEGQHPLDRGFDHFLGILGGSRSYFPTEKLVSSKRLMLDRETLPEDFTYLTDTFEEAAQEYIEKVDDTPFFMYLAPTAAHGPAEATKEDLARFPELTGRDKVRAAMIAALDDLVGTVVKTLEKRGMLENTLIYYMSDNGGKRDDGADNGIYREGKGSQYEGGSRVPMVLSFPKKMGAGLVFDGPVSALDFAPTALGLAQIKADALQLEGRDLLPYLGTQKPYPEREIFHRRRFDEKGEGRSWIRVGDWKLMRHSKHGYQLFDLGNDPGESKDLAASKPGKVAALKKRMIAWESELPQYDPSTIQTHDSKKKKKKSD